MPERRVSITGLCLIAVLCCTAARGVDSNPARAPDHILVQFDPLKLAGRIDNIRDVPVADALRALALPTGCAIRESGFSSWRRSRENMQTDALNPVDLERYVRVTVPPTMTPESLCAALRLRDDVRIAEPDGIGTGGLVPDDPDFTNQWFHNNTIYTGGAVPADVQSTSVWEITTGGSNVIVAVLDTGLVPNSAEFSNRVVGGYNFVSGTTNWADDHNHGSLVAGVMAANANNGTLVAGMNWNCRIMPVKVLNSGNSGTYSDFTDGLDFAVSNGAKIINFSIGGTTDSSILSNAIMNAIAQGVIFITITHNDGLGVIRFPGRMKQCITVGATTNTDIWAKFSNYGSAIDLCAPGDQIVSVNRFGSLSTGWFGTSFSCPLVSGVAAMIASIRPEINQAEMEALLCASADDQVGDAKDTAGWDQYHGWGRLNAYNALVMATSTNRIGLKDNGRPFMSWDCPPNASNRSPYRVEFAPAPNGPWVEPFPPAHVIYDNETASWVITNVPYANAMLRVISSP